MKITRTKAGAVPRGRPRTFCADVALDAALRVFWRNGYEGASLSDLTAAMKISRPSLYAAFGNKEQLFRRAMDRYSDVQGKHLAESMAEPTSRAAVERLFRGTLDEMGRCDHPAGCFLIQGALACGEAAESVRKAVAARRTAGAAVLQRRFERGAKDGDLPPGTSPADLARYFATVLNGIAVQAAGGATAAALRPVVELAMAVWD